MNQTAIFYSTEDVMSLGYIPGQNSFSYNITQEYKKGMLIFYDLLGRECSRHVLNGEQSSKALLNTGGSRFYVYRLYLDGKLVQSGKAALR